MKENKGILTIENVWDFDPDQIFDCGQCFRWEKDSDGCWKGITGGRRASLSYEPACDDSPGGGSVSNGPGVKFSGSPGGKLTIRDSLLADGACSQEEALAYWRHYLDLDRDYGAIKAKLSDGDPVMAEAISYGSGIRILRQDPWEALISFIISQNNNIPRIKKCIESLAEALGEERMLPLPEVLAKAKLSDLADCRLGYRDKYLIEAAGQFIDWGMPETAEELQKFSGVGPKVANCIALFGLGLVDSFPIDVWMRRVMNRLYGFEEKDVKGMAAFAAEKFAPYGGIAQQYLFYYITHKGVDKGSE